MMNSQILAMMFHTRIHKEAWFFVRWSLFISAIFFLSDIKGLWILGLCVSSLVMLFFRHPKRIITPLERGIFSPADGLVVEISHKQPPEELQLDDAGEKWTKIGIFLAPWDVHINRIPCDGSATKIFYRPGAFAHVVSTETRVDNERLSMVIKTPDHHTIVCTQIAGFLARRIICYTKEDQAVTAGHDYGLICFGSHVDLYLPASATLFVVKGQRVRGGESILGILPAIKWHGKDEGKTIEEVSLID